MNERLAILALLCWLLPAPAAGAEPDSDASLAAQMPRIPPKAPAEARQSFELLHGFEMQLAAHEPDVVDPVDAAFDEDGRLWVVEMRGYPFPEPDAEPIGRVRVLTDEDDDGVFETSRVFAENLYWPTGIALWKGGCFVVAAPDLLYLRDDDGDGRADVRQTVFTGFDRKNVQALANNLKWGVDNRIHGASSSNGGEVRSAAQPDAPAVSVRGRDFSFDPRTGNFSQESGTAQFGNSFNDWYDRFVCSNSDHAVQVVLPVARLERNPHATYPSVLRSIAKEGGAAPVFRKSAAEPWRLVRTARRAASGEKYAPTELFATGYFTSASGVTIYRGDAYPDEFRGDLIVGDVGGNLIHRKKLDDAGAFYVARRADQDAEFVRSTDNWFRPVNFVNGPDGCLYVLDMYRETIEHPWSIPEDIKSHLDLESGRDRGRVYRLAPPDFRRRPTPRLGRASTAELVPLLAHPNSWHRETAQRLLIERADENAPALLRSWLAESGEAHPLGSLHALWTLHGLGGPNEEDVVLGLDSPHPRVREHALRLAEPFLPTSPSLRARVARSAEDSDYRVRLQAAFVLGALPPAEKGPALWSLATRDDADAYLRAAVLSSAGDAAAEMIAAGEKSDSADDGLVRELARIVAARNLDPEWAVLARAADAAPVGRRLTILAGMVEGAPKPVAALAKTLADRGIRSEAWAESAGDACALIAFSARRPPRERLAALRALQMFPVAGAPAYRRALLSSQESTEFRLAALRELDATSEGADASTLRTAWRSASPSLRSEILETMLSRGALTLALLEAVESGEIAPGQVAANARQRLLESRDATVRERASKLFAAASSQRGRVVAEYVEAFEDSGDREAGRKVYDRECASCHKLGGKGSEVGPDLATVRGRTPQQLIANILDPNQEVLPAFTEYTVLLQDGRVATGLLASESAGEIRLRRAEGIEQIVPRDEIDEIQNSGRSLMPEGLEQKIPPREMSDLIAFLRTFDAP